MNRLIVAIPEKSTTEMYTPGTTRNKELAATREARNSIPVLDIGALVHPGVRTVGLPLHGAARGTASVPDDFTASHAGEAISRGLDAGDPLEPVLRRVEVAKGPRHRLTSVALREARAQRRLAKVPGRETRAADLIHDGVARRVQIPLYLDARCQRRRPDAAGADRGDVVVPQ